LTLTGNKDDSVVGEADSAFLDDGSRDGDVAVACVARSGKCSQYVNLSTEMAVAEESADKRQSPRMCKSEERTYMPSASSGKNLANPRARSTPYHWMIFAGATWSCSLRPIAHRESGP